MKNIRNNLLSKKKKFVYYNLNIKIICPAWAIWKSPHLGISTGIDVGIGIGISKIFFVLRSYHFCLSRYLMKKTSMVKSFSSTLAYLLESFSRSYSVENPSAPASEERNSTVNVISGVLKTFTAESCILQGCKFLKMNPIRDQFLETFCKF